MKWYIIFVDKNGKTKRFKILATDMMTARTLAISKNNGGQVSMSWPEHVPPTVTPSYDMNWFKFA